MILQKVLAAGTEEVLLYCRGEGGLTWNKNALIFEKNAMFSTDTYLNAFSVGKWCTYCQLNTLWLMAELMGHFRMAVNHAYEEDNVLKQVCIWEQEIDAGRKEIIRVELPRTKKGVIFFTLHALDKAAEFYQAWYECDDPFHRDIAIALNICTFKRESYLMRNLNLLQETFLKNNMSPLYGRLKVFITDNGSTLDIHAISDENVHICHNPNVGGAGGFARGLIEISQKAEEEKLTHVIFMDDDIEILPESLLRTYHMLRLLKEEYRSAFIAGAHLRLDTPYIQHENGALWNAGKCVFINRGMDLRSFKNVVRNENIQKADYAAWWYCCIPIHVVRKDNLPIPVFIHEDDVEYSLRNAKHIITINGIAIRHPVADNRRESSNEYYNLRNMLIVNAKYVPQYSAGQIRREMLIKLMMALLRYRYKDMHLIYRALKDFCKGPDWLLGLDAASYHKQIQQSGYKFQNMQDKIISCRKRKQGDFAELNSFGNIFIKAKKEHSIGRLLFQLISLNGWLLPAKKETYVFSMSAHPIELFRMGKVILYDNASGQGLEVKRTLRQIFVFMWLYLKSLILIAGRYKKSATAYRERFRELQNISYWRSILGQ